MPRNTHNHSYNCVVVSAIGDPLAHESHWRHITQRFLATFPRAYFYHMSAKYAALLQDLGYWINDVGAETTLQVLACVVCACVCRVCVCVSCVCRVFACVVCARVCHVCMCVSCVRVCVVCVRVCVQPLRPARALP
jgi:hypothetical protein